MRLSFCAACGCRDLDALEHHHLLPRSLGGSDDEINLITLCAPCHGRAHSLERVSTRHLVRRGLAAAKARGTKLGNAKGIGNTMTDAHREKAIAVRNAKADERAGLLQHILVDLRAGGATTLREIAAGLNERAVPAPRGGRWQAAQVSRVLARLPPEQIPTAAGDNGDRATALSPRAWRL